MKKGNISGQPKTSLCMQFWDKENNGKINRLPFGPWPCVSIVGGFVEILPPKKIEIALFMSCIPKSISFYGINRS